MIRINQLKLNIEKEQSELATLISKTLRLSSDEKFTYEIAKKSIARETAKEKPTRGNIRRSQTMF